ncbi:purine-nucleoside phosphorylase [Granulosicoccaceae sp. 1_MG-2023]|nr:purine-nucleoside phosphorylase [Granulosicoccaceae sp. 1_MG-2023]
MHNTEIDNAVSYLQTTLGKAFVPDIALVLGSGLGDVCRYLNDCQTIAYEDIPGFPRLSVRGHGGQLIAGMAGETRVLVLRGRAHCYESGNPAAMRTVLRTVAGLDCPRVLLTCAAGSLNSNTGPGSLMLIRDHINLTGLSPLTGEQGDARFLDLSQAYDPALRASLARQAGKLGLNNDEGVYMWFPGPNFETPAEIRAAGLLGADAVGMSVVPETILARHAGMQVAALAVITNYAAGIDQQMLSHEQTIRAARQAEEGLALLLRDWLSELSR